MPNSFSNWTPAMVAAHNARVSRENRIPTTDNAPISDGHESDLHAEIAAECKRRGWIALHGSMARSTGRTLGEWDFVVLADAGRTFLVECKTKTGKQSPEQLGLHHWAKKIGHVSAVVRSLADFNEVIETRFV